MSKTAFKAKAGDDRAIPNMPPDDYKGRFDPLAEQCGFIDKFQLQAVMDYLHLNGQNALKTVS